MRFSAILFDLDGTLIDTISLYRRACIGGMKAVGLTLAEDDFHDLYVSGASIDQWVRSRGGNDAMTPVVREERDRLYRQALQTNAEFFPGAEDLLRAVAKHPKAIVTGSWRSYVDALDECTNITDHFEHIVTADDTNPFHKPHPHGFLLAADRLGVEPKDCLVVGDQMFDIEGAKAAGMTSCLTWTAYTPKHAAGKADMEIRSLTELEALLY